MVCVLNLLMPPPESDPSNWDLNDFIAANGFVCKKQKSTFCSQDQKVDQFPTCSATAQFLKESQFQHDTSNGYLEDVIPRTVWCKEQNLSSCSKDQKVDQFPRFSTTVQPLHDCGFTHQKRLTTTSVSSSRQGDTHEAAIKHDIARSSYASEGQGKKIAYPFKLVKSGGVEGETTLKDINRQILTTPSASKPIPHPVRDDSVTRPCKLARVSGKAVASLTRIHTRGRGSITIIRTKD